MIPRRIKGHNRFLGAPPGWDEAKDGKCEGLAVRTGKDPDTGLTISVSAWEPTPDELAILNAGGSVILWVVGGQPPVMLGVEESVEEFA